MIARETPTRGSVLVADDDRELREGLVDVLEHEGFSVLEAVDGPGALETILTAPRPCLVLLDLVLPRYSGLEVLARLEQERPERVRVFLMTGRTPAPELPPTSIVADVLIKPFTLDALLARMRRFLAEPG